MDTFQLTAPCGLDCFNCMFFLAHEDAEAMEQVEQISKEQCIPVEVMLCKGCRPCDGQIRLQKQIFGEEHRCSAYECCKGKGLDFCGDCDEFPCDHLQPFADKADILPHNIKVFNLCLIKRLGLEQWAETKAAKVRESYFNMPWSLARKALSIGRPEDS